MRIFLTLSVWLALSGLVQAEDWPQWLGPRRDSSSSEVVKAWKEPLKVLWKSPVGEGHGAPVIANGKVFLHFGTAGKFEETVAAFDADTGKPVWNTPYARAKSKFLFGNGPRSAPAVVDGKVYAFGITGILSCIDADSGKTDWQVDTVKEYQAPTPFFGASCSPLVEGDAVLVNVGAKGASIVAFNRATGKEIWKKLDDRASYSSPISVGKGDARQVIFLTAKGLVSVSPKDGSVFWQSPLVDALSESSTTPVMAGDLLFASSITFGGLGLNMDKSQNPPTAKKGWMNPDLTCYFATPVAVGKDHLYMVTGTKPPALFTTATLRCVATSDGKEMWKREKVGTYHASLLRTGDDKLLLVEEAGTLVLVDPNPSAYRELSRSKICGNTWAHPALANGRLYIRDGKDLVCVEMPK